IGGRSMRTLFVMVAQVCQFSRREMLHHGRGHEVVEARYVAFILMRALYQKSMPEIGRFFLRDHTTIINRLPPYPRTLAPNASRRSRPAVTGIGRTHHVVDAHRGRLRWTTNPAIPKVNRSSACSPSLSILEPDWSS